MTTQALPLLTTRIRQDEGDDESTLARQWRLLKLLAFAPKGFTVKELTAVSGVSEATVRRDLAFLRRIGFDVAETVEDYGRKAWRVRRLPESTGGNGERVDKYGLILDALQQAHDASLILGDVLLAADLEGMQLRVRQRCQKPKPR